MIWADCPISIRISKSAPGARGDWLVATPDAADQILIFCQTPERQRKKSALPSSIRYNTTASQPP
jgi:hypothetical protein